MSKSISPLPPSELDEEMLYRRSPLPKPVRGKKEADTGRYRKSLFGCRHRQATSSIDESESYDTASEVIEEECDNPTQYMPDWMYLLQKAVNSAAKYNDEPLYFGNKPIKWVTRAEASISRNQDAIDQQVTYYAKKARSCINAERKNRAVIKGNLWRGLNFLASDQNMRYLIESTGQRYEIAKQELSYQLDELSRQDHSSEKCRKVEEEYEFICCMVGEWPNASESQAAVNVQLELSKFQRAWQAHYDSQLGRIENEQMMEHAANAIAWKIRQDSSL